jgi:maltooligosyltrehalose trehalohydrolase
MIFRVWAPRARAVTLVLDHERRPMLPQERGWWSVEAAAGPGGGARYRFALDDGEPLPDPRSGHQPEGVFGP